MSRGLKVKAHRLGAGAEALRQARLLRRTPHIIPVLAALVTFYPMCATLQCLADRLGLTRGRVRNMVRNLKRRGMAEHQVGLFYDDGRLGGSGYAATTLGKVVSEILKEE